MDKENAFPLGVSRTTAAVGRVSARSNAAVPRFDEPVKTPSLDSSVLTNRSSSFYANLSKRIKSKKEVGANAAGNTIRLFGERNVNVAKSDVDLASKAALGNTGTLTGSFSDWTRRLNPKDLQGQRLLSKVVQHVNDSEKKISLLCWKEFLDYIQSKSDMYPKKNVAEWLDRAIELLPSSDLRKDSLYIDLALRWAMSQSEEDIKESKIRLKWIVANRIGMDDARTYVSRAKIEYELSGSQKARKTIEEGISRGAEPIDMLLQEMAKFADKKRTDVRFNDSVLSDIDISVKSITCDMRNSLGAHVGTETGSDQSNQAFKESQERNTTFSKELSSVSALSSHPPPVNSISESLKRLLFEEDEDEKASQDYIKSTPKTSKAVENEFKSPPSNENVFVKNSTTDRVSNMKITPDPENIPKKSSKTNAQVAHEERHVRFEASDSNSKKSSSPTPKVASSGPNQVFVINGKTYHKLEIVGKGGSGKVYKVIGEDLKIYALKRVKFNPEDIRAVESYKNEISLLRSLKDRPNIIQMYECSEDYKSGTLFMLFEFGEIDLARTLKKRDGKGMNINYIKTLWQQMLEAVQTIHEARIVHGDLKPANFIFVSGDLKLIDFGIAKAIQGDTTHIERDTQIGTVNYMSPEAILSSGSDEVSARDKYKLTRASDIWSLGCILYQMVYGKTPFHDIPKTIMKLYAIADPHYPINFAETTDPQVIDVLKLCLKRNPSERPSIPHLLQHSFLSTNPTTKVVEMDKLQNFLLELQKKGMLNSGVDHESLSRELMYHLEKKST